MIEVELAGVRVEMPFNSPTMLLREANGERVLPIIIDVPEAQAIGRGVDGIRMARPMTHDLLTQLLATLETELVRVVVTDLRDRTFFAELVLNTSGIERRLSSRPSDAVAIAVRVGAPIFVAEEVFDLASQPVGGPTSMIHPDDILADFEDDYDDDYDDSSDDPDDLLDEFKQFLSEINPEDFDG